MEHKDIPDDGLHEPKGVVGASAGQVYVADGLGSGSWQVPEPKGVAAEAAGKTYYSDGAGSGAWRFPPQGWGYYVDNAGISQVINTTPTVLTINALGAETEEDYLPREIRGVGSLWDNGTNLLTPVALGDAYEVRLDFTITGTTGSPTYILLEVDIGSGSPVIIMSREMAFKRTATPFEVSVSFGLFAKDTFLANGAALKLSSDTGTVTLGERSVLITRVHGER